MHRPAFLFASTLLLATLTGAQTSHEARRERPRPEEPRHLREPASSLPRVGPPPRQERRELPLPGFQRERQRLPVQEPRPLERRLAPAPRVPRSPVGRSRDEARTWQERMAWRQDAWQPHPTWQEHRARRWEVEHRTWTQRGGYGGYFIPEAQFNPSFGEPHGFRLAGRPAIYGGYPRFWCRGYWFLIVDPWPEFWIDDWYLDDDLYIDFYLDGYYLFNRRYPHVGIALAVSI